MAHHDMSSTITAGGCRANCCVDTAGGGGGGGGGGGRGHGRR